MVVSLLLRVAMLLVSPLPEAAVGSVGRKLGYLASFADWRRRKMAERHMSRVLGGGHDARAAAREVFASYGRYWAELFWLRPDRLQAVGRHISVEGAEHLAAAMAGGRGMILAVPHVGNWEIGACVLIERGIPVTVVAEALADSGARRWLTATRRMLGMEVLLADGSANLLPALARRLKAGRAVGLMSDRNVAGAAIEVRFFGETTSLPAGAALLAELTGAPILPAAVYFCNRRGHRVVIRHPLESASGASRRERRYLLTQRLAEAMEALVREAPTQWHLLQPNWPSDRETG